MSCFVEPEGIGNNNSNNNNTRSINNKSSSYNNNSNNNNYNREKEKSDIDYRQNFLLTKWDANIVLEVKQLKLSTAKWSNETNAVPLSD